MAVVSDGEYRQQLALQNRIAELETQLAIEVDRTKKLTAQRDALLAAITEHHAQKADDRCWMDDDKLYAAAGLPLCDRRVGDKQEMLLNCARFLEKRCEEGGWPSYREVEAQRDAAEALLVEAFRSTLFSYPLDRQVADLLTARGLLPEVK